ncbi:MAG: hypothetical protein SNG49_09170 [Rikenellaceae bacterium]
MKRIIATIALSAALLTSCYKAELHETSHPDSGEVTFFITAPTQTDDTDYTAPMTLAVNGEQYAATPNNTLTVDLLDPGNYTYYIYNDSASGDTSKITYTSSAIIASVDLDENGNVESNPNRVYFGSESFEAVADTNTTVTTYSSCVGRDLHFILQLEGDATSSLEGFSANLSGVAQQWDCIADVPYGDSASLTPTFTLSSDASGAYYLKASVHLLGISTSATQVLTIELSYAGENPATHTFSSEVSSLMSGFNNDKSTSMTISNTIETPTGVTSGGTIGDWIEESYTIEAK